MEELEVKMKAHWNLVMGFLLYQGKTESNKKRIKSLQRQINELQSELDWHERMLENNSRSAQEFAQKLIEVEIDPQQALKHGLRVDHTK